MARAGFFSRAVGLYVPWPEVAGKSFDCDAIFNGVNSIGRALEKICGSQFNHFDNVDCQSFRTQLKEFIKTCRDANPKPNQAIVYICSHGVINPKNGELHLMMKDSPNPANAKFFEVSISGNELRTYIQELQKAIPGGKVLVLLDCCRSGALFPRPSRFLGHTDVRNSAARAVVKQGWGRMVFMSCEPTENSYITNDCPRFTKAVAEVLMGTPKGVPIDLLKLIPSVKTKMEAWSSNAEPQHPCEHPPCWSEQGIKFGPLGLGDGEEEAMDLDQDMESGPYFLGEGSTIKNLVPEDASPDQVKEYFNKIKATVTKLENSMEKANAPDQVRELIDKAQKNWSTSGFGKCTKVVICGGTGHGKSTLINALVGDEVLPAGEEGGACTSAVIEVKSNTEDEKFRATVHFLTPSQWEQVLCSWIQFEGEESKVQKMADDVLGNLEALFGESKVPQSKDGLLNHEKVKKYLQGTVEIAEENVEDFVQNLENYVLRCESGLNLFPVVSKVTVLVPRSTIREDIVLVDIPGYYDNSCARKAMADQQFREGDIVWIVANAPRAVPNEVARTLISAILKGGISRSCSLAYICTQNDKVDNKPRDYRRHFKDEEKDPDKKKAQEEIIQLLDKQKEKTANRQELEKALKLACARWRRHHLRVELQKATEELFEKEKLGKQDIGVFTVSALDCLQLLKGGTPNLYSEMSETGIPGLQQYAPKAVDKFRRLKVEEAYQDLLRLCLKLNTKIQSLSKDQDGEVWEKNLESLLVEVRAVIDHFEKAVHENVKSVEEITKETIKEFSQKAKELLNDAKESRRAVEPSTQHYLLVRRGFALGDCYEEDRVGQVMVECIVRHWKREFDGISGKMRQLEEDWMGKPGVAQAFEKLRKSKSEVVMPCVALFGGKMRSVRIEVESMLSETRRKAVWTVQEGSDNFRALLYLRSPSGFRTADVYFDGEDFYRIIEDEDEDEEREELPSKYLKRDLGGEFPAKVAVREGGEEDAEAKFQKLSSLFEKTAEVTGKKLLKKLSSVEEKIKGELSDFAKEINETLTTKLEGLEDTPQRTKKKLVEVVQTFDSDVKALRPETEAAAEG